ncbi:glutamate racemase [Campylobacter troglodytis]|nr:glutamate racemase [Campylobacter troglodytis]
MTVGVFDSGVGGLTVLKSLLEARLFDELVYYGDTARVPYGVKDKDTIIRFSLEALEFFKPFKLDLLVIACNTVSAYALDQLRKNADFAVFGVIDAGILAVKEALKDKNSQILVLGTRATISSKQYQKRLLRAGFNNITALATGLFVPMVEEGIFEGQLVESLFDHYFKPLNLRQNLDLKEANSLINSKNTSLFEEKLLLERSSHTNSSHCFTELQTKNFNQEARLNKRESTKEFKEDKHSQAKIDALILGCTHFPLLSKSLQGYFGEKTRLIHSGDAIADQLQRKFKLKRQRLKSKVKFYASSDLRALKNTAKLWLGV